MISIRYSSIPPYLHQSAFYRSLSKEEVDSDIQIPSDCYKIDDSVENVSELSQMLQVERFWGLDELPWALMEFCYRLHEHEWKEEEYTGYPALVDMLHVFMHERPLIEAMTCGSRSEIFLFLVGVSSPDDVAATRAAASLGRLDFLIILRERGYQWDNGTCNAAAEGGHLDCLKYAKDNSCPWNPAGCDNLVLVVDNSGFKLRPDVCENAAKNEHLHCLQYAFNNGCPWSHLVATWAATYGHADCLRFALENECPIRPEICTDAARSGHLECLMLLHQYNVPWDKRATKDAAAYGHLQCLQYLHENGCPWDMNTTLVAACLGRIDCLRYAISHGCPYAEEILAFTIRHSDRSRACLEYLIGDLGLYMNEDGSLFVQALQLCLFPCLEYLIDMGCPMCDLSPHQEPRSNDPARDEQLLLCLEYATRHGWCWNDVLVDFLCKSEEEFPTCWAFVTDNDCYMTS